MSRPRILQKVRSACGEKPPAPLPSGYPEAPRFQDPVGVFRRELEGGRRGVSGCPESEPGGSAHPDPGADGPHGAVLGRREDLHQARLALQSCACPSHFPPRTWSSATTTRGGVRLPIHAGRPLHRAGPVGRDSSLRLPAPRSASPRPGPSCRRSVPAAGACSTFFPRPTSSFWRKGTFSPTWINSSNG